MPFSLSASTLTHSGTDADLSDLSNIVGVTIQSKGSKTSYYLDNTITRLVISGDLQATAEIEEITFAEATTTQTIQVTGLFKIGKVETINGIVRYSKGDVITMPRHAAPHFQDNSIVVKNGGRVEWRGGTINVGDAMGCEPGGTFEVWDGRFVTTDPDNSSMFIRNDAGVDDVKVHNVELDGLYPDLGFASVVYSLNGLNTFSAKFLAAFIQPKLGVWGAVMKLRNMSFAENANTFDAWYVGDSGQGENKVQPVELTNIDVGTGLRIVDFNNNLRIGHYSIFQEVASNVIDGNTGLPIENAVHFVETTDNGKRINVRSDQFRGYLDFESDTYASYTTTSDVDGNFSKLKILTGRLYDITLTSSNPEFDLYSETNVPGTDNYTHYFNAYGYRQSPKALILKSADVISYTSVLFPDLATTEPDYTIVATYDITINHTEETITVNSGETFSPKKTYDYVSYDKLTNPLYPTKDTMAVTSSDGFNFVSTYRVIVEVGAVFDIDPLTEKLTIDAPGIALEVKGEMSVGSETQDSLQTVGLEMTQGGAYDTIVEVTGTMNFYSAGFSSPNAGYLLSSPGGLINMVDSRMVGKENGGISSSRVRVKGGSINLTDTIFKDMWLNYDDPTKANIIGLLQDGGNGPEFNTTHINPITFFEFRNYDGTLAQGEGAYYDEDDIIAYGGAYVKVINPWAGSDIEGRVQSGEGVIEVLGECNVNVKDINGGIENVKLSLSDTVHSDAGTITPKNLPAQNYTNVRTYSEISDVNGDFPLLQILSDVITGVDVHHRRCKFNDITGKFDLEFCSYNHQLKPLEIQFNQLKVLDVVDTLTLDEVVSEADKAVVDLYSEVETAEKIYDVAKSWVYDNDPDADETIVTRFTSIINARAYDVDIDATAILPFDFIANTIILKATNATATINTTGIINIYTATTQAGGASGDVILNGTASISDGIYSKIILSNTYTPTTITLTNVTITEIENQTGNDIVINNVNSTITTKTELSGRFFAEIKDGIVDVGSRDVVYDTGATPYISIAGEIITINAPTNAIQTTGIVTALTQLTANIIGDFETATPIDILSGVEIITLRITSGTAIVDISNLEITTLNNSTGAPLFYIGEAENYIGDWNELITLTIQLSEATDIYITDADTQDVLLAYTQSAVDIPLQISGVANARITVNQVGKYAKTYDVAISGDTFTTPVLDSIPFYDPTGIAAPLTTDPAMIPTAVINLTFESSVHLTHADMIATLDRAMTTAVALEYFNINNIPTEEIFFTPTASSIIFLEDGYYFSLNGDIIVTTDSFLDATYLYSVENSDNRKLLYSPTFPTTIDYPTIANSIIANNPAIVDQVWDEQKSEHTITGSTGAAVGTDKMTEAEVHIALDNYTNKEDYKSDVSGIPTNPLLDNDSRLDELAKKEDVDSAFEDALDYVI